MVNDKRVDYDDEPKYFAVPDPYSGDMTYWVRDRRGNLSAWPRKPTRARYGPILHYKPGPGREHVVPAGLELEEQQAWIRNWSQTVSRPWWALVLASIKADPAAAHARFAAWNARCFVCGRVLIDDDSKVWGVGPVCRPLIPPEVLEATAREIGRLHADALAKRTL